MDGSAKTYCTYACTCSIHSCRGFSLFVVLLCFTQESSPPSKPKRSKAPTVPAHGAEDVETVSCDLSPIYVHLHVHVHVCTYVCTCEVNLMVGNTIMQTSMPSHLVDP